MGRVNELNECVREQQACKKKAETEDSDETV